MKDIPYIDRYTGRLEREKVYKGYALRLVYGNSRVSRLLRPSLLPLLVKFPFFSRFYGFLQKRLASKKKIKPFIETFKVDPSEFLHCPSTFRSFNDFFIRKLKPEARPIDTDPFVAIMPADARYYFFQNIKDAPGFIVKGEKFDLAALLQDAKLAEKYQEGSMLLARLCPTDYHRFHFPCDCVPGESRLLNGWLYSVNPIALKRNIHIFSQNKRRLCELQTEVFGKVLYMEIGATNVGSIQETYTPFKAYAKGEEKGYFEFGGSALVLLFEKGTIQFDADLLEATAKGIEIRCLMGQRMGLAQRN